MIYLFVEINKNNFCYSRIKKEISFVYYFYSCSYRLLVFGDFHKELVFFFMLTITKIFYRMYLPLRKILDFCQSDNLSEKNVKFNSKIKRSVVVMKLTMTNTMIVHR